MFEKLSSTIVRLRTQLFLIAFFGIGLLGADPSIYARPLVPEDLWNVRRIADLAISPDGHRALFTVQQWSVENNVPETQLWLLDLESRAATPVPGAAGSDLRSPAWSPDSNRIAFVSKTAADNDAVLRLYSLQDYKVTDIVAPPFGVYYPAWAPDGRSLYFATQVFAALTKSVDTESWSITKADLARRKAAKAKFTVVEAGLFRTADAWLTEGVADRIVRIDLADGSLRDITPAYPRLFSPRIKRPFAVSGDGKTVAVAADTTPMDKDEENDDILLFGSEGAGLLANITAKNPGSDVSPCFSPDGAILLYGRRTDPVYAGRNFKLMLHDIKTGKETSLAPDADLSFTTWRFAPNGKSVLAVAEQEGRNPIFRIATDSGVVKTEIDEGTSSEPQELNDGSLLVLNENFHHPTEVYLKQPGTVVLEPVTQLNVPVLRDIELGRVESKHFIGANGDRVQLWVTYPADFDPKRRYPLVHLLHGGPHSAAADSFSALWNPHVFAARGAIVVQVNRHGSTGFGERFARSVVGNWRDGPVEDILRATDFLQKEIPSIDKTKIAACGISYGGYLAVCLEGKTDRFACLIDHAGISDLYTQYSSDLALHLTHTFGGYTWQDQKKFAHNNPVTYAANFKTPLLIVQGGKDNRVPEANSLSLFSVLRQKGVPVRLVYFPDEAHWVRTPQNSLVWHREVFAWLDRWLATNQEASVTSQASHRN